MAIIKRFKFSTAQIILFSFIAAILVGSFLLALPISAKDGSPVSYIDALFTATTATCVTGLVTLPTVSTWSVFGQIIILLLIQIGGLGIITVLTGLLIMLHKQMGLSNRLLIQDAFNLNTMSGLSVFVKKVILGAFIVEGVGALLYMTVFIPEFGIKGIWISIFNSVSAFCNAGIDIIAENSLQNYAVNPIINTVTCALIILGGIGFIVWWDLISTFKHSPKKGFKKLKDLSLHTKIVLCATSFLIVLGTALVFTFEYNNPQTLKDLSLFDKLQVSFFQSVTTRTAGFFTIPQQNLTNASSFTSLLLMFIGGSPVGTAGGIKTVTFVVLFASAAATVKAKNNVRLFNRSISRESLSKAVAVVCCSLATVIVSTLLLSAITSADSLDVIYETVSATATVGLSRNLTPTLNLWGKLIIIVTMFFGRIGPISLAISFKINKPRPEIINDPVENISIG